jgi:hypothetical protein
MPCHAHGMLRAPGCNQERCAVKKANHLQKAPQKNRPKTCSNVDRVKST